MRYLCITLLFFVLRAHLLEASNFVINGVVPVLSIDDVQDEAGSQLVEVIDESQSYFLEVDKRCKGEITVQLQLPLNSDLKLLVEMQPLGGAKNHGVVDVSDGKTHKLITGIKEGEYFDCYIKYYFSASFNAGVLPPTSYGINYLYQEKEH